MARNKSRKIGRRGGKHGGRDAAGHVDPFYQRRRRFEPVLRSLDLDAHFARVPRFAQESFWTCKYPDPLLEYDPSFPADRALREELERALRTAKFDMNGESFTVRDFCSVVLGMQLCVHATPLDPRGQPQCMEFLRLARTVLSDMHQTYLQDAVGALLSELNMVLLRRSRCDTRLLSLQLHRTIGGRPAPTPAEPNRVIRSGIRFTAVADSPQSRSVRLDGRDRPVWRIADTFSGDGVRWLSWTPQHLQTIRPACATEIPLYVQSHALHQLHERVNLPTFAPYLESWLANSLREPKIVERLRPGEGDGAGKGGEWLVEFAIGESRIGYLIATVRDDMVIIRTFLFLTMQGTPESRRLRRRLNLRRDDINWLRLSELSAYTQTDLRDDAELRELFTQCGCGHLFDLDKTGRATPPRSHAADVRKYLQLAA